MIKVIKQGSRPEKVNTVYKAGCNVCGCVFEFELSDCDGIERRHDGCLFIRCPECSTRLVLRRNSLESRVGDINEKRTTG